MCKRFKNACLFVLLHCKELNCSISKLMCVLAACVAVTSCLMCLPLPFLLPIPSNWNHGKLFSLHQKEQAFQALYQQRSTLMSSLSSCGRDGKISSLELFKLKALVTSSHSQSKGWCVTVAYSNGQHDVSAHMPSNPPNSSPAHQRAKHFLWSRNALRRLSKCLSLLLKAIIIFLVRPLSSLLLSVFYTAQCTFTCLLDRPPPTWIALLLPFADFNC